MLTSILNFALVAVVAYVIYTVIHAVLSRVGWYNEQSPTTRMLVSAAVSGLVTYSLKDIIVDKIAAPLTGAITGALNIA